MTETYSAVAYLTAHPGSGPELLAKLQDLQQVSAAEPGTRQCTIVCPTADAEAFIVFEAFDDEDAYQAHESNPEVLAVAAQLGPLLASADVKVGAIAEVSAAITGSK